VDIRQPGPEERERSYHAIRSAVAAIDVVRPGAIETANFLLDEAKSNFERTVSQSANLESKATTLLGIVAGATGILGVFSTRDGSAAIKTPLVGIATVCILVSLLCLFYILRAKSFESPNMSSYVCAAMVREDNRLGLALALAETYRYVRARWARELRIEGSALFTAHFATVLASVFLLLNAIHVHEAAPHRAGGPTHTGNSLQKPKGVI
jgi:hypothetical protein